MLSVDELPPVADLLPHDPPMVLLDDVRDFSSTDIECTLTIRENAPFCHDGKIAAIVALEYMAQAAGVLLGVAAYAESGVIKRGFLLGSREMRLDTDYFEVGDTLHIHVKHVWGRENMANFECHIIRDGMQVAWATINVLVLNPDGPQGPPPGMPQPGGPQ